MQLASYARDAAGRLHFPGTTFLRTFHRPVPPQDLTEGQGSFVDKDENAGSSVEPIVQALRSVDIRIGEEIHFVSFLYTKARTHWPGLDTTPALLSQKTAPPLAPFVTLKQLCVDVVVFQLAHIYTGTRPLFETVARQRR